MNVSCHGARGCLERVLPRGDTMADPAARPTRLAREAVLPPRAAGAGEGLMVHEDADAPALGAAIAVPIDVVMEHLRGRGQRVPIDVVQNPHLQTRWRDAYAAAQRAVERGDPVQMPGAFDRKEGYTTADSYRVSEVDNMTSLREGRDLYYDREDPGARRTDEPAWQSFYKECQAYRSLKDLAMAAQGSARYRDGAGPAARPTRPAPRAERKATRLADRALAKELAAPRPTRSVKQPVTYNVSVLAGDDFTSQAAARPQRPPRQRCGKCAGCTAVECGTCIDCLDKPRFGGQNKRRNPCVLRKCLTLEHVALDADERVAHVDSGDAPAEVRGLLEQRVHRRDPPVADRLVERRGVGVPQHALLGTWTAPAAAVLPPPVQPSPEPEAAVEPAADDWLNDPLLAELDQQLVRMQSRPSAPAPAAPAENTAWTPGEDDALRRTVAASTVPLCWRERETSVRWASVAAKLDGRRTEAALRRRWDTLTKLAARLQAKQPGGRWMEREDDTLRDILATLQSVGPSSDWAQIARDHGTRTATECRRRWEKVLHSGAKKGRFTATRSTVPTGSTSRRCSRAGRRAGSRTGGTRRVSRRGRRVVRLDPRGCPRGRRSAKGALVGAGGGARIVHRARGKFELTKYLVGDDA